MFDLGGRRALVTGATGGIGMGVDAASEDLAGFYGKFGFRRIPARSHRLFLPTRSLVSGA